VGKWTDVATWRGPTENEGPALTTHRGLVLHIAQGYYEGTIAWQKNPDANVSSHFVIGKNEGECAQIVDTDRQAWTQRAGNSSWMSSENAGFVPDALTAWQIEANARIFAKGHLVYGWPLVVANNPTERGLGHHSMDREGIDAEWGHDDCPGSNIIKQKQAIVDRAIQIVNGESDDMEQTEKLINDTGSSNRTVGNVLADVENLRNWLVSTPGTSTLGTPPPGSVGAIMLESAQKPPVNAAELWAIMREDTEWRLALAGDIAALINRSSMTVSLTGSMSGSAVPTT